MGTFPAFLLHEYQPKSYAYLSFYLVEVSDKKPVKYIEHAVLTHIKSLPRFQRLKSLEVAKPEIYLCLEPLQGQSQPEKRAKAIIAAKRGELENFPLLVEDDTLEEIACHDLIVILKTSLRIKFAMLELKSKDSYDNFGSGSAVASLEDSTQTIYDAARSSIVQLLTDEDPWTTATVDSLSLYELDGRYEEEHKRLFETGKLEPGLLRRGSAVTHEANTRLETIETSNLIFVFTATRSRPLRIPYALFYSESGSYQFVGENHAEAYSEDTVGVLHEAIHRHIEGIQSYNRETRWDIVVYEPQEAFGSAYNKQPNELGSLKLKDQHLPGAGCSILIPGNKLSSWREGQALIVVFRILVQPQRSPAPTSLLYNLRHLYIGGDPPSTAAKLENYRKFQLDPKQRILDDRPEKDDLIAPISLLYQPFGYFRDIRCGVKAPGGGDIHEGGLQEKVDALADAMTLLYKSEEERTSKFLEHLEYLFGVPPGSINASKIPGGQKVSDGHVNGMHGAMVFCVECKNELSAASCEPTVQLVSYIAASLKSRVDHHPELFQRWRVPALGVTHVGSYIQFFGVVWVGKMRVVPLTPSLPMVDPTGEEFRWDLFLAFKAASIVFRKIQTDVKDLLQVLKGPPVGWPPVLTTEACLFPSVTEIDIETNISPDTQLEKVKFVLESRHDNVEHRHLYHAHLVSPASSENAIYVKFSQRYSVDLHRFCASRGLAPKVLGFQRLSGGWFAVAMEKVNIVDPRTITSFPEAGEWERCFKELVNDFHREDFVHGDLRLANFVFTESNNPRKMVLVDFDWGGKEGEVVFPHERLNEELGVPNDRLCDRQITKVHDQRCLSRVLEWLSCCTPANPVQVGPDTEPDQAMDG